MEAYTSPSEDPEEGLNLNKIEIKINRLKTKINQPTELKVFSLHRFNNIDKYMYDNLVMLGKYIKPLYNITNEIKED